MKLDAHPAHTEHDHRRNGGDRVADHESVGEGLADAMRHNDCTRPSRGDEEHAEPKCGTRRIFHGSLRGPPSATASGAHVAARIDADWQGFAATNGDRIASLSLLCPTAP